MLPRTYFSATGVYTVRPLLQLNLSPLPQLHLKMSPFLQASRSLPALASTARGSIRAQKATTKNSIQRSLHKPSLRNNHNTYTHSLWWVPISPHYQFYRWQSQQTGGPGVGGASDYQIGPSNGQFGAPLPPFLKPPNKPHFIIDIQPGPDTQSFGGGDSGGKSGKTRPKKQDWKQTAFKMFEASATTAASIAMLGYEPRNRGCI